MKMKYVNLILLTTALSACTVGKDYAMPKTDSLLEKSFKQVESDEFSAAEPVADWWKKFEDKQLTNLVEKSLEHNYDIKIAMANLNEARAVLDQANLGYFPTIEASANADKQKFSDKSPFQNGKQNNFSTGFDASWELDLFGHVSQTIEANKANSEAREAALRGTYVSVAAEVARAYIELRGAQYRLNVAKQNADNQQKTYDLITLLEESGSSDSLDLHRAKTQLELTNSTIPLLEANVNSAINRLSVLTGQKPSALHQELAEVKSLPSIPESVNLGNPIDLLKRRPDVVEAERNLASATARYNVNVANLYPKVSLLGSLGFLATSFADLGSAGTSTFLYGAQLDWAALNIGRINTQIEAADARTKARLAEFEKTVLQALEDTDNSIVNFSHQEKNRERLFEAANSSAKAAEFAQDRFDAGIDSYLDVLDAQRTMLDTQDRLAQSETQVALNLIAVYKALGGGWEVMENSEEK